MLHTKACPERSRHRRTKGALCVEEEPSVRFKRERDQSWSSLPVRLGSAPRLSVPADPSISLQARRGERLFEGSAANLTPRPSNPILVIAEDNYPSIDARTAGANGSHLHCPAAQIDEGQNSSWELIRVLRFVFFLREKIFCSMPFIILLHPRPLLASSSSSLPPPPPPLASTAINDTVLESARYRSVKLYVRTLSSP